eukprot:m51a1_g9398 hypothetical protein (2866) ;mRNA; f:281255-290379
MESVVVARTSDRSLLPVADCETLASCLNSAVLTGSPDALKRPYQRALSLWLPRLSASLPARRPAAAPSQAPPAVPAVPAVPSAGALRPEQLANRMIVRTLLAVLRSAARSDPALHAEVLAQITELAECAAPSDDATSSSSSSASSSSMVMDEFGRYLLSAVGSDGDGDGAVWSANMAALLGVALHNTGALLLRVALFLLGTRGAAAAAAARGRQRVVAGPLFRRWRDAVNADRGSFAREVARPASAGAVAMTAIEWPDARSFACEGGRFLYVSGPYGLRKVAVCFGSARVPPAVVREADCAALRQASVVRLRSGHVVALKAESLHVVDAATLAVVASHALPPGVRGDVCATDGTSVFVFAENYDPSKKLESIAVSKVALEVDGDGRAVFHKSHGYILPAASLTHVAHAWTDGHSVVVRDNTTTVVYDASNVPSASFASKKETVVFDWQLRCSWSLSCSAAGLSIARWCHKSPPPVAGSGMAAFASSDAPLAVSDLLDGIFVVLDHASSTAAHRALSGMPCESPLSAVDVPETMSCIADLVATLARSGDSGARINAALQYLVVALSSAPLSSCRAGTDAALCDSLLALLPRAESRDLALDALALLFRASSAACRLSMLSRLDDSCADRFYGALSTHAAELFRLGEDTREYLADVVRVVFSAVARCAVSAVRARSPCTGTHPAASALCGVASALAGSEARCVFLDTLARSVSALLVDVGSALAAVESDAERASLLESVGTLLGELVGCFSDVARSIESLDAATAEQIVDALVETAQAAAPLARVPTGCGRECRVVRVVESAHPVRVSTKKRLEWAVECDGAASPLTVTFAPDSFVGSSGVLLIETEFDRKKIEGSFPESVQVSGSHVTFQMRISNDDDGTELWGFRAAVSWTANSRGCWATDLRASATSSLASLLRSAMAAQDPGPAVHRWLSTSLFSNGRRKDPGQLPLFLQELLLSDDPATPASLPRGSASDCVVRLAKPMLAAVLWHTTDAVDGSNAGGKLAEAWGDVLARATALAASDSSPECVEEVRAKARLLLSLQAHARGAPQRSLTASMAEMKRKFYPAPPRGRDTEALSKLTEWRSALIADSASRDIRELVHEFLAQGSQVPAEAVEGALLANEASCAHRTRILAGLAGLLSTMDAGSDPAVASVLCAVASACHSNDVFSSTLGVSTASVGELTARFFAVMSAATEMLRQTLHRGLSDKVVVAVVALWHTGLGSANEDYVAKTGVIPQLLRLLSHCCSAVSDDAVRDAAFHLLVSLASYCFEQPRDANDKSPSCRGFVAKTLCDELASLSADSSAPPDQPGTSDRPPVASTARSGMYASLLLGALLVLSHKHPSAAQEMAYHVRTDVMMRLYCAQWAAFDPSALILRLLREVLPLHPPEQRVVDGVLEDMARNIARSGRDNVVAEAAMLLRSLAARDGWDAVVRDGVRASLRSMDAVLDGLARSAPFDAGKCAALDAALAVLGGVPLAVRVGGRARVVSDSHALSGDVVDVVCEAQIGTMRVYGTLPLPRLDETDCVVTRDVFVPGRDLVAVDEFDARPLWPSVLADVSRALARPPLGECKSPNALAYARVRFHATRLLHAMLEGDGGAVARSLCPLVPVDQVLSSINEAGVAQWTPYTVRDCATASLERRVRARLHGTGPITAALGISGVHASSLGFVHAPVFLPPDTIKGMEMLVGDCVLLGHPLSSQNYVDDEESEVFDVDRSDSEYSLSLDSAYCRSTHSDDVDNNVSTDDGSSSDSSGSSGSMSGLTSLLDGSDDGSDSDGSDESDGDESDEDDDPSTTTGSASAAAAEKSKAPGAPAGASSEYEPACSVFQTQDVGETAGRVVVVPLSMDHSSAGVVRAKTDELVSAGALAVVFATRKSLGGLCAELAASGFRPRIPVALAAKCVMRRLAHDLRVRQAAHALASESRGEFDNVLALNSCSLSQLASDLARLGSSSGADGALPPRYAPARQATSLPGVKQLPAFVTDLPRQALRSNMYMQDEEPGGVVHWDYWAYWPHARFETDVVRGDVRGLAVRVLDASCDYLRQQVALRVVAAAAASPSARPACPPAGLLAPLLLGSFVRSVVDAEELQRKAMVLQPMPPPSSSAAAACLRALLPLSPAPCAGSSSGAQQPAAAAASSDAPAAAQPEEKKKRKGLLAKLKLKRHSSSSSSSSKKSAYPKGTLAIRSGPKQTLVRALVVAVVEALGKFDDKGAEEALGATFLVRAALCEHVELLDESEVQHLHFLLLAATWKSSCVWVRQNCCRLISDLLSELRDKGLRDRIPPAAMMGYACLWEVIGPPHRQRGLFAAALAELLLTARAFEQGRADLAPPRKPSGRLEELCKLAAALDALDGRPGAAARLREVLPPDALPADFDESAVAAGAFSAEADQEIVKRCPQGAWAASKEDLESVFAGTSERLLRSRAAVLYHALHKGLEGSVQLVDFYGARWRPRCIARRLAGAKARVALGTKLAAFHSVVSAQSGDTPDEVPSMPSIHVNRVVAKRALAIGQLRQTVLGQVAAGVARFRYGVFNSYSHPIDITFVGEAGYDAGGLYRECLSTIVSELQSGAHLLQLCPNGRFERGGCRDKLIPKPSLSGPEHLRLFEFVGRVLGHAVHSAGALALSLPSLVWKPLVGSEVDLSDLRDVDTSSTCIERIRAMERTPDVEEMLSELPFTTVYSDGKVVALKPGGESTYASWDTRLELCDLMEQSLLHCYDGQLRAVRRGLCFILPEEAVDCLLTWRDAETLVCGEPRLDIARLKTAAGRTGDDDEHVKMLWDVLEEMTPEEQSKFLRFVTGHERMPPQGNDLSFTIETYTGSSQALPMSGTCSGLLTLPRYTSKSVMRTKLLYAINNCPNIDGDGETSRNVYLDP